MTAPKATVQICVILPIRASLRLSSSKDHSKLVPAIKAIDTARRSAEQALGLFGAC
nr:hypothetical protein [Streptomyces sp. 3211]